MAESPDVVSALAEVLVRRCVGRAVPGDGELARSLARELADDGDGADLFAAGAAGAWAGFGPDGQLDGDTIARVVDLCRGLLRAELPVEARALVCAALGLLAARGTTFQPGVDFVNVATAARAVEQHGLALWAARRALGTGEALSQSHRALALLTVAVITRDPASVTEAYAAASSLEPGDVAARAARILEPTLRDSGGLTAVGEAVRVRDRRLAAESLLPVFEDLRQSADDDLLAGLHEAFAAMAAPVLDVEGARRGLTGVVGHLRGRQRFGEVPPVARAGVDMAADLLALDADPAAANVLTEFVEALADAGLSEVAGIPAEGVPAVLQARLAYLAQKSPIWTDLTACVTGLRGRLGAADPPAALPEHRQPDVPGAVRDPAGRAGSQVRPPGRPAVGHAGEPGCCYPRDIVSGGSGRAAAADRRVHAAQPAGARRPGRACFAGRRA